MTARCGANRNCPPDSGEGDGDGAGDAEGVDEDVGGVVTCKFGPGAGAKPAGSCGAVAVAAS